jgi:cbb3-type cytochrome oxidase subunit 3
MQIADLIQWLQQYGIVPVVAVFVLIVLATYWPSRRQQMERNARIPFADDQ